MTSLVTLGLVDFQVESRSQVKNRPVETTALHSSLSVALAAFLDAWKPVVLPIGREGGIRPSSYHIQKHILFSLLVI